MKRIKYKEGEEIGSYGVKYVEEIEPDIYKNGRKERKAKFLCPRCGKIFNSRISNVKSGTTKSCGCYRKETSKQNGKIVIKDLTGKKINKITILKLTDERYLGETVWECQCDCGKKILLRSGRLKEDRIYSCGCENYKSKGELKVFNFLQNKGIKIETQKTFDDCRNPETKRKLFFDFYLPDYNCCIEYDGEQHFISRNNGWNTFKHLEDLQFRDDIKNQYCKNNHIKLIRIPYTEYENIENFLKKELSEVIKSNG